MLLLDTSPPIFSKGEFNFTVDFALDSYINLTESVGSWASQNNFQDIVIPYI
jgi:hypothetical protein